MIRLLALIAAICAVGLLAQDRNPFAVPESTNAVNRFVAAEKRQALSAATDTNDLVQAAEEVFRHRDSVPRRHGLQSAMILWEYHYKLGDKKKAQEYAKWQIEHCQPDSNYLEDRIYWYTNHFGPLGTNVAIPQLRGRTNGIAF